MIKIGITGSNNTGKTTLAYKLATLFRVNSRRAEIAHESVRCCPLGTKSQASIESQIWIIGNQIKMEEELCASEDIVICDKTVVDTYCYGLWAFKKNSSHYNKKKLEVLQGLTQSWIKTYDLIFYLPISDKIPYKTWHNGVDHREALDNLIIKFLEKNQVNYHGLPLDFEQRIGKIMSHIEKDFDISLVKQLETS